MNSAQSTQNKADLKAYVYTVNPMTLAFSANPVFQTSLNYQRGDVYTTTGTSAAWNPWSAVYENLSPNSGVSIYPQPMLTGIAFDASGNMTLGLRDRSGDQTGYETLSDPANPTTITEGVSGGDTLQAFIATPGNLASGWTLENNGRGPSGQGTGTQSTGLGPGGAEYFSEQNFENYHDYVSTGVSGRDLLDFRPQLDDLQFGRRAVLQHHNRCHG